MTKIYKTEDLFKFNPEKFKNKKPSGLYGCLKGKIHCTNYKKVFNLD